MTEKNRTAPLPRSEINAISKCVKADWVGGEANFTWLEHTRTATRRTQLVGFDDSCAVQYAGQGRATRLRALSWLF